MIFITVGSRSFQFNRLLLAIDQKVEAGEIKDEIFAQIGSSGYKPGNYGYVDFMDHDQYNHFLDKCDVVITHGGTGVIVNAVKKGKRVIAVPRLAKYQEAVDDHQLQLVQEFEKMDLITACYDCEKIAEKIRQSEHKKIIEYHSNTDSIIRSIETFIQETGCQTKKILVVSNMYPSKKAPGAGIFVKRFCEELDKINISYKISVMYKHRNILGKLIGYFIFYITTFLKILFQKYDAVYIHYASHSSFPVLAASRFKKFRIYTNVHGSDVIPENKRQEKFQRYTEAIIRKSNKIVVPSEYFKRVVLNKYRNLNREIMIYPSAGVDKKVFSPMSLRKQEELKEKYKINRNQKVFSYAGRISRGKGWNTYLLAVSSLIQRGYYANYIFVGDGSEASQYDQLVRKLGIQEYIRKYPLMEQEDLAEIYNICDAFVFPTEREGESLGLVALEALSCGTPVISSDFAAPKYYIKDGYNGYKYPVGDYEKLADLLSGFMDGRLDKQKLQPGAEKTSEKYSNGNSLDILKRIFEGGSDEN